MPVIAGDIPALREVGGDAVCYVHPEDLDAQASALVRLAEDPAFGEGLRIRGPERAGLFSWERSASALAAAYARACEP